MHDEMNSPDNTARNPQTEDTELPVQTGREHADEENQHLPEWAVSELRMLRKELYSLLTMIDSIVDDISAAETDDLTD